MIVYLEIFLFVLYYQYENLNLIELLLSVELLIFGLWQLSNYFQKKSEIKADNYSLSMLGNHNSLKYSFIKVHRKYNKYPSSSFLFNLVYNRHPIVSDRIKNILNRQNMTS